MAEETAEVPTVNIDVAQERKKPRLEAMMFADYAAISTDGKALIAGVFDRVFVLPDNDNTVSFYLYIRVGKVTRTDLRITIYNPKDEVLASGAIKVQQEGLSDTEIVPFLQLIQRLGFKVQGVGEYWVDLSYKGQSLGGVGLMVDYHPKEVKDGDTKD